jgi:hypothetical protein
MSSVTIRYQHTEPTLFPRNRFFVVRRFILDIVISHICASHELVDESGSWQAFLALDGPKHTQQIDVSLRLSSS